MSELAILPLLIPLLSGAVRATAHLLTAGELVGEPLQLMLVTDATYLIISFVTFDYVLDE